MFKPPCAANRHNEEEIKTDTIIQDANNGFCRKHTQTLTHTHLHTLNGTVEASVDTLNVNDSDFCIFCLNAL